MEYMYVGLVTSAAVFVVLKIIGFFADLILIRKKPLTMDERRKIKGKD
jgi:hypothetical protein